MMRLVRGLAVAGLMFLFAPMQSGWAQSQACEKCETVKAQKGGVGAPVDDYVCLFFVLPKHDKVTLFLYNKDGSVDTLDAKAPHGRIEPDGKSGRICPSRAHFQRALTMELCAENFGNAIYNEAYTTSVAEKPKYSHAHTGCLNGKVQCEAEGYRVRK